MFELLQSEAQTPQVREHPMLIVPPMINKYYITDLAPDRSMVEHLVRHGQQVFAMSWRNPDERHAGWGLENYVEAVLEALDAVDDIGGGGGGAGPRRGARGRAPPLSLAPPPPPGARGPPPPPPPPPPAPR